MKLCLKCNGKFSSAGWRCPCCGNEPENTDKIVSFSPEISSEEGFKDEYFQELSELEELNFWFRARSRLITWALSRYFSGAKKFLEVGCGTGFVLSQVATAAPGIKIFGSEISNVGLSYAANRLPSAEFFQMDARAIPFANEFDVIGAFDVLEHIEDDMEVIIQMHRATCSKGGILLTVPQHDFLWSQMDEHACHVRRYAARDLLDKVTAAGFKVERLTSFVSLMLPIMIFSRKFKMGKSDPLAELRINGFLNVFFEKIMDIERYVIIKGIKFPVGGSLLLVARKSS